MNGQLHRTILAVLIMAAACTKAPGGSAPLVGTEWRIVDWGSDQDRVVRSGATLYVLLEDRDSRAHGNTGCNSFGGPYEVRNDSLRFGPMISTRRACLDPAMNAQEGRYLRRLADTRTWRIVGDTLVLSGATGPLARLAAVPRR